jgi:ubiquitin C-terminal hydrolase
VIECSHCHQQSFVLDPMFDLSLTVSHDSSIVDSLNGYTSADSLPQYRCDKCGKLGASIRLFIEKAPLSLVLHIKRASSTSEGKLLDFVSFPVDNLDLKPFLADPKAIQGRCLYRLYSVVEHKGETTRVGHFVSTIRRPSNRWYFMDDDLVEEVSQEIVRQSEAYMLFYIRQ